MKVELHHLDSVCSELDKGNVCPHCPKVELYVLLKPKLSIVVMYRSETLVLSADALFGLPRKKAADVSHRQSLHGDLFFDYQPAVDEHMASYEMPNRKSNV